MLLISQTPNSASYRTDSEVQITLSNAINRQNWSIILFAVLVLVAMVMAYTPVLFNFFTADDFHFIYFFDIAKHNPTALIEAFMHGIGPYYRPICITVMFCEYLLFGTNALLFRLVSLGLNMITTVMIVLLIFQLTVDSGDQNLVKSKKAWAIAAASLFALYPLHTEPVDWVICHTDLLTNLFVLSSLWLYISWRRTGKLLPKILSCIISALAFLTKETAVIIPVLITMYEIMVHRPIGYANGLDNKNSVRGFFGQLLKSLRPTSAYWAILFLYFGLRLIVIGSFTGTWNNAVFYNPDTSMIVKGWLQSLKMIVVPFSLSVFNQTDPLRVVWIVALIALVSLTIWSLKENKKLIMLALFLCFWFILCLLPVYKLLYITPDLLNCRYGFLSSVPLCAFLALGVVYSSYMAKRPWLRNLLLGLVLCLSFFVLRGNNLAWAEAGRLTNNIVSEIQRIHRELDPEMQTYLVNVPFLFKGVAIEGMDSEQAINHKPFAQRDSYKCQWLRNVDQSLPIGLLKNEIESGNIPAVFYTWNMKDNCLHHIDFSKRKESNLPDIKFDSKKVFAIADKQMPSIQAISSLGEPLAVSNTTFTFSPADLDCWSTDLIVFTIDIQTFGKSKGIQFAQLEYTSEVKTESTFLDRLITPINSNQHAQTLIFPVRGIPIWAFGGHCQTIQLKFPKGYVVHVSKAYAAKINKNMPQIELVGAHYNRHIGQLELSSANPQATINYDGRSISNCAGVALEVIGSGEYYRELNSANSDMHSLVELVSMNPKGQMKIDRRMLATNVAYKVRLRPIDKQGHQCGFCSDHFITVVLN